MTLAQDSADTSQPAFSFPMNGLLAHVPPSPVRELIKLSAENSSVISFAGGHPDPALFDSDGLARSYDHVIRHQQGIALQYGSSEGTFALRQVAAERISRFIPTSADEVLVTSGSQQGISLSATMLLNPGDVVLVEQPTYMSALQCMRLAGARPVGVAMDDEGMLPDALEAAIAEHSPKLLYTIPTFQNPTGITMSARRRKVIAEVLRSCDLVIFEDDPYSSLRFEGDHIPPLLAEPGLAERGIYAQSLSKVLSPGIRIGWLRAPQEAMDRLAIVKQTTDIHTASVDQMAAAHYLANFDIDAGIQRIVDAYRPRRDHMIAELEKVVPDGTIINRAEGGMFLWLELPGGFDAWQALPQAINAGVTFVPGPIFYADSSHPETLRLSFVTSDEATITEGIARLGRVLSR